MRSYVSLLKDLSIALLALICLSATAEAQNNLYRISNASRSDGLGHVIRFHLASEVDSFKVIQPAPDFVQVVLHDPELDTTGIRMPDLSENVNISAMRLTELEEGVGIDIILEGEDYFKSSSYPDKNGAHVLVALSKDSQESVERFSDQFVAIIWETDFNVVGGIPVAKVSGTSSDNNVDVIKDKLRFDKVVIDAGHGGHEPGAVGHRGILEKDITLKIALMTGKLIEERIEGVEVVYTRTGDTYPSLDERGHFANLEGGDLFISIHCNSAVPQAYGTEVYFLGQSKSKEAQQVMMRENSVFKNETQREITDEDLIVYELAHSGNLAISEKVASYISWQFKNKAKRRSRGVKQAPFQVLYGASMPAVLVEAGFITNPNEMKFLTTERGQMLIASAIYRAVKQYKYEVDPPDDTSQALNANE